MGSKLLQRWWGIRLIQKMTDQGMDFEKVD